MTNEEKKIVVDEDWKSQVEAEKEKLQEDQAPKPEGAGASGQLPPPSFQFHVSNLATQALMFLGQFPNPMTQKQELRLDEARHIIDTLSMIQEKTKGNLDAEETQLMEGVLHELRVAFVAVKQAIAEAEAAGATPAADSAPSGGSIEIPE